MRLSAFWLCNVERDTPLGCGTTAFSGVPAGARVELFRADGSAVLLASPPIAAPPARDQIPYTLVRLGADPKATSGDRVSFTEVNGPIASVRLR